MIAGSEKTKPIKANFGLLSTTKGIGRRKKGGQYVKS